MRKWLEFIDVRMFKVKLGSPEGIEADQAMLMAVKEEAPPYTLLYVQDLRSVAIYSALLTRN